MAQIWGKDEDIKKDVGRFRLLRGKLERRIHGDAKEETKDVSLELSQRINSVLQTPIPDSKEKSWNFTFDPPESRKKRKGLFFKDHEDKIPIADLRKAALKSPGIALKEIRELLKKYPYNPDLNMLSAICTNGVLTHSTDTGGQSTTVGLRYATGQAANALYYNGISLFNTDTFLSIYFRFLEHLKKEQKRLHTISLENTVLLKQNMPRQIQVKSLETSLLLSERIKLKSSLSHLINRTRSSSHMRHIKFEEIKTMAKLEAKKPSKEGEISLIYSLALIFSRIPLLTPLVQELINFFPTNRTMLNLQMFVVRNNVDMLKLKLAKIQGDISKAQGMCRTLYKNSETLVDRLKERPIYYGYEAYPFLNTATVAYTSPGLLSHMECKQMANGSMEYLEALSKFDASAGKKHASKAQSYIQKLELLLAHEVEKELRENMMFSV